MSGGSWEYVAAYIDNGNMFWNIGEYGIQTFFSGYKLAPEYAKYFDIYEPGDEEMDGTPNTYYDGAVSDLWSDEEYSLASNTKR